MKTIAALLLAIGLVGCSDQGPEAELLEELERNRRLWDESGPSSYIFAVERLCFCGDEARGPVRLTVDGDAVTSRLYVDTGQPVDPALADLFPTVDGLFDVLSSALKGGAYYVEATYDPGLGVPIDFWVDYDEHAADEELGFEVTEAVAASN